MGCLLSCLVASGVIKPNCNGRRMETLEGASVSKARAGSIETGRLDTYTYQLVCSCQIGAFEMGLA